MWIKEIVNSTLMVKLFCKSYSIVEGKRQRNKKYQIKIYTTDVTQSTASEISYPKTSGVHQLESYRHLQITENNGNSSTYYVLNK